MSVVFYNHTSPHTMILSVAVEQEKHVGSEVMMDMICVWSKDRGRTPVGGNVNIPLPQ